MKNIIFEIVFLLLIVSGCNKDDNQTTEKPIGSIELISGNNQLGDRGLQLSNQIVIKINNEFGAPYLNFPIDLIHLEVAEGAVFFGSASVDNEGKVYINWTLGNSLAKQTLTVSVTLNSVELENSPITVTAIPQA